MGLTGRSCANPMVRGLFVAVALVGAADRCGPGPRAFGVYAHETGVLVRVDYDANRDGRIDTRAYMRDGRPRRVEIDANGDDLIDRWEYYGAAGVLERVGTSTLRDGREDAWTRDTGRERHVDLSTRRDGVIDRREVYRGGALVRAETDTNRDGLPDTWEEFEDGAVRQLLLDDQKRLGRPTRRLVYGPGGAVRIEPMLPGRDDASR